LDVGERQYQGGKIPVKGVVLTEYIFTNALLIANKIKTEHKTLLKQFVDYNKFIIAVNHFNHL
jgi:hypothetical protein